MASDSPAFGRVLVLIGILALFSYLLYPADSPPLFANVSNLPQFSSPFDRQQYLDVLYPVADGEFGIGLFDPILTGCTVQWKCVRAPNDAEASYLGIDYFSSGGVGHNGLEAKVNGIFPDTVALPNRDIVSITVNVNCRTNTTGVDPFKFFFNLYRWDGIGAPIDLLYPAPSAHVEFTCPKTQFFGLATETFRSDNPNAVWQDLSPVSPEFLEFTISRATIPPPNTWAQFTYVEILVTSVEAAPAPCGGDWFSSTACQIGRFFTLVYTAFVFIGSFLIYLGSWGVFLGTFAYDFMLILLWWYAIPGAPLIIQIVADVLITGLFALALLPVGKLIRGSGPV